MPSRSETIAFLARVARALATDRVRITWKADDEIADLGWSHTDRRARPARRVAPRRAPQHRAVAAPRLPLIWIFCPALPDEDDTFLWIRLAERSDETFVVSFQPALRDPWR